MISWPTIRLKFLATVPMKYGANEEASDTDPDQPRFVRITDISEDGGLRPDTFRSLPLEAANDFMLQDGDVLFARSGATVGKTFRYDTSWGKACFAGYLIRFRCDKTKLLPEFLGYFAQSVPYWDQISASTIQATIQNFSAEKYGDLTLIVPPKPAQERLVTFLDEEIGRIDHLVHEKERMLELLAEKRVALVTQAVTRGLGSKVRLKPSGLDWLGEIPAHWRVERLKFHLLGRIEQGWSPQCDNREAEDDEWGVLKVGCVNGDYFDPHENKALPTEIEPEARYEIRKDDILLSRGNTPDLVGQASLVPKVRPNLLLCDLLYRCRVDPESIIPEFAVHQLRSLTGRYQIERDAVGSSGSMKKIGQETIQNFIVMLPSIEEQSKILASLAARTARIDAITETTLQSIKLLRERRSAVITAAVTGQLDFEEMTP